MEKVAEVLEGLREEERRLLVELSGVRYAIAALEKAIGLEPRIDLVPILGQTQVTSLEPSTPPPATAAPVPEPEPGPYAACGGVYSAAAEYLATVDEPKSAREIAEALRAGGYPTKAWDFTASVRTMLHRDMSTKHYGICRTETGTRWFVRS